MCDSADPNAKKRRGSIPGFLPIKALKNYMSKFKIQARVVEKTGLNTFQGRQGPGKVFTCVLVDSESTAINAKFWGDSADQWFDKIHKGKVYSFHKGRVQLSNKRFAGTVDHDYEVQFDKDSEIQEIENAEDVPTSRVIQYSSLRSINMSTKLMPFITNVLGVVHAHQQPRSVQSKTNANESRTRRVITIVDATRHSLDVTFWGDLCDVSESLLDSHPVVSLANMQIREWNGKAGSTLNTTEVDWEPSSDQARELKKWYDEHAHEETFQSLNTGMGSGGANARPVKEATLKEMHHDMETVVETDEVRMYRVHVYIMRLLYRSVRQDNQFVCIYPRCSKCGRKLADGSNTCCVPEPVEVQKGLSLACLVADASCSGLRVTFFHDQAQTLLGTSATKVADWIAESGSGIHPEMNDLFEDILLWKRYTLTIRGKRDNFRNQFRTQFTVVNSAAYTPGASASQCMASCLKLIANIFDGANCKRVTRCESAAEMTNAENQDGNPKRKLQCLDSPHKEAQVAQPQATQSTQSETQMADVPSKQTNEASQGGEPPKLEVVQSNKDLVANKENAA
eukprot:Gregarina_sp_Pseudo_9__3037@NODE_323_length_3154_cov_15_613162_g303_i0_p1_GENE_NODE_323_length_3154_cov_15_613162_g303_i0NODE_323_length_3154_cov_15_613162_g303_i0_p1_ORF_typecomplete_len567_score74_47REPA_OB_2/PF16900_5/0_036REPA_OB_2/PF16900_5/3_8e16REPA_OB_2/PF16900_5/55REPA_OB_2/PF16900_5/1_2e03Rep_facA_C/PF08646_10/5_2e13DUF223/PF02721_14/1_1e10DUF223/PF02721_14/2e03tRNA_anticodon/PF01336_25/2_2e06tRNA_anticodon/PF01336_25/47BRCA2_OB3/PF09104_10/1_7BRCA2_OB3/PF09104_10/0_022BRCA2_OB3/PF0910